MRDYLKLNSSLNPKEAEEVFQEAFKEWETTNSKKAYDIMWIRVYECCRAIALRIAPGKPLVEERALEAAITIIERMIRLKQHPNKLSSWCYLPVRYALQGNKAIREDREMQYDDTLNTNKIFEPVRGICRQELVNTAD